MKYIIPLLILLSACSTPYKPSQGGTGYTDTQVNTDSFIVGFKGGAPLRTKELALLRSAQVALANGYSYFVVTQVDDLSTVHTYSINSQLPTAYSVSSYHLYHHGGEFLTVKKPHFVYTIVCYKDRPETPSYDARMVIDNISQD